ncbi:MAG: outer membrane protein transport protein [candidate division Zixibacteria bacterium]
MAKKFAKTLTASRGRGSSPGFVLVVALIALSLAVGNVFAGGFALSGVGSKAIGMGGAFRGLADDWSAAYWNPAGLTQLEQSEITGMGVFLNPRIQYTPSITYGGVEVGYRNGDIRYPNDKTLFIPDVGGFFKLENVEGITAGLAIFVPNGLSSEWDLFNPSRSMDIRVPYPWYDHKSDLKVIDFHPTVAKSFMDDRLSLGLGISLQHGSIIFKKTVLTPSGIPIPHENLLLDIEIDGDGWGYGANFGVLYKLSDKLQFGLSGRTGTTLKMEGIASHELYVFDNDELKDILIANKEASGASPAEIALLRLLFGTDNLTSEPDATADVTTPADFGFGLAFKPTEKLTFSGEVAYTQWSALDSILIELDGVDPIGQPAEDSPIMLNWENTLRFSFGAEYWAADPLAIRLGYYFDPSPIPDETFSPLIPDLGDKHSLNLGTALLFSDFELSYNFEYISFADREITDLTDANGDGLFDNYPGFFESTLYASHVSLTYRF